MDIETVASQVPSFEQLARLAPTSALTVFLLGLGYWTGWKSRASEIAILREWLANALQNKRRDDG